MSPAPEHRVSAWESLKDGAPVAVGIVKLDLAGGTEEWSRFPPERVRERRDGYRDGVDYIARSFDAASSAWVGDGIVLFLPDGEGAAAAPIRAFRAAKALWERVCAELGLHVRIAAHAAVLPWNTDTGRISSPDLDVCGHLEAAAPVDSIAMTEDVYWALPDADRGKCAPLGLTVRDGASAYVYPAAASAAKKPEAFHRERDQALWDTFRQYTRSTDVAMLRYVGLRLVRKEPPSLHIHDVFVPLDVDRRERRPLQGTAAKPGSDVPFEWLGAAEYTTTSESFSACFARSRDLVVLGEPGGGKSTLLRWLAVKAGEGPFALAQAFGKPERLLPLPIGVSRLAEIRRSMPDTAPAIVVIARYLASRNLRGNPPEDELVSFLGGCLDRGECLVLLDGLDEVKSDERDAVRSWLEAFASNHPRNRFVVSSRPVGYSGFHLPDDAEVHLKPFSDEQVERYVRAFCGAYRRWETQSEDATGAEAEADKLLRAVRASGRLSGLARNPFLLSGMALIHRAEGRLPRQRVQFYEIFARCLCEAWGRARGMVAAAGASAEIPFEEEGIPVFGALALRMHTDHPTGRAPRDYVLDVLAETLGRQRGTPAKEAQVVAREFLKRAGEGVQLFLERGPDEWGFFHLTFQEFFVAAGLHAEERFEEIAAAHLFDPRWEEVIRLGVGYMALVQKRPRQAGRFVLGVLDAQCPDYPWIVKDLQLQVPLAALLATEAGEALGQADQDRIVNRYADWVTTTPLLELAHRVSGELSLTDSAARFAALFLARIGAGVPSARAAAIRTLGVMKATEAVEPLLGLLRDADNGVRAAAAGALGAMEMEAVVAARPLLDLLRDEDHSVRVSAAHALSVMKTVEMVELLLDLLRDRDRDVRSSAALALGEMKVTEAVKPLLGLLRDRDPDVRSSAARVLGAMKVTEAVKPLLGLLRDEDSFVRYSTSDVLGALKATEAVEPLLGLLHDKNRLVRSSAAWALGEMKVTEAVKPLLNLLCDEISFVRSSAARALGEMKVAEAVEPLLDLLHDKDLLVRYSAAWALGEMKVTKAVKPLLNLLCNEFSFVRSSAALALGEMKALEALDPLVALMGHASDREAAVRALAELAPEVCRKSPKGIQVVIPARNA